MTLRFVDQCVPSDVETTAQSCVLSSDTVSRAAPIKHSAVLNGTTQAWVVLGTFSDSDLPFIVRVVALDRVAAQATFDALNCLLAADWPEATIQFRAASPGLAVDQLASVIIVATSEQLPDPENITRASIQGVAPDAWLKVILASVPSAVAGYATGTQAPEWLCADHGLFPLLCLSGDGPDGHLRALSATIYSILAIPFLGGMTCVGLSDLAYILSRRVSRYATAAFESLSPRDSEARLVERCWSKVSHSDRAPIDQPKHSFLIRFADNTYTLEQLEAMGEALGKLQSAETMNHATTRVSPTRLNCLPGEQGAWAVLALPLADTVKAENSGVS